MELPFKFLPALVMRSPLLSYGDYSIGKLDELLQHDWFKLAIYLASSDFYQRLELSGFSATALNAKERITLLKYYNRMSFRPTPFGAFSSFGTLNWCDGPTSIQLSKLEDCRLKLLVDQSGVNTLSGMLRAGMDDQSMFSANPTLYKTNKEFRYVKTITDAETGKASYLLESFEANRFTNKLLQYLKKQPESYAGIIAYIKTNTDCTGEDAAEYLGFLIAEQIVQSEQNVSILGEDHLSKLVSYDVITSPARPVTGDLLQQMLRFKFPDIEGLQSLVSRFNAFIADGGLQQPKQLFYANTERAVHGTLDNAYQQQLADAVHCARILSPPGGSKNMADFIKQFKARFDMQKVPLLHALDPEISIGYSVAGAAMLANPLLQDMHIDEVTKEVENINWSAAHRMLLQKWNGLGQGGANGIAIEPDDLEELPLPADTAMPPSMPVMFRLYDDGILIEAAGGVSATALIGRFTLLSPEVYQIAKTIAQHEQQNNPDVLFAEINQLSDSHVDNINRRLPVYDYGLPINAPVTAAMDKQLQLDDLVLSVANNELILESISLKKRIIPRLSSAYNFQNHQLSLFKFLGDVQQQGIRTNYSFDLEAMFPGMAHYPRVSYQKTILCLAKWYVLESEINHLTQPGGDASLKRVKQMRIDKGWPAYIALSRADQQLVFNLAYDAQALLFVESIRGQTKVMLAEYPMPYSGTITNSDGKPMVNQLIAFLVSTQPSYKHKPWREEYLNNRQAREYVPGSKWIYLKIYCATARANDLLVKKILPVLHASKNEQMMGWFFIRYKDTAPHIRLRIQVTEDYLGNVLVALKSKLAADVRYQLIQEYTADVYRRELERYGADIMDDVEHVFEASSELVIHYLKATFSAGFNYTYHSLAIVSVAEIIARFFPDTDRQINFAQQMALSFSQEHKDAKALKFALDKKYRAIKDEVSQLLADAPLYYKKLKLTELNTQLLTSVDNIISLARDFPPQRKWNLAADLIHMHLNRLFADEPRYQELVIYHCLHKHFQSVLARAKR